MEESTREELSRLLMAVKALLKSSEKALLQGLYDGTGETLVRQYQRLQPKVGELLPDDFYIKEMLGLELPKEANEEEKVGLVRLLCDQMVEYLSGTLKAEARQTLDVRGVPAGDINELGRNLQDQMLSLTKKALQRALSHMDVSIEGEFPTPPIPPIPPVPPTPPHMPMLPDEDE